MFWLRHQGLREVGLGVEGLEFTWVFRLLLLLEVGVTRIWGSRRDSGFGCFEAEAEDAGS